MADGTDYGTKPALIDSIKALIYTNTSNEVSADDEQTAMLNIVETAFSKIEANNDHSNLINLDAEGAHDINSISANSLSVNTSLEDADTFILRKAGDWVTETYSNIKSAIASATMTLTNKTIVAADNSVTITLDEVTDGTSYKKITATDKANLTTLTNGSDADALHTHDTLSVVHYIKTVEELETFFEDSGAVYGEIIDELTFTNRSFIVSGNKKLSGKRLILGGTNVVTLTGSTAVITIDNLIYLNSDTTLVNFTANDLYLNVGTLYSNNANYLNIHNQDSGIFEFHYGFIPLTTPINYSGTTVDPIAVKDTARPSIPVDVTEYGTYFYKTTTFNPDDTFTFKINYELSALSDFTTTILNYVSSHLFCRLDGYEDVLVDVTSVPVSGSTFTLSKFINDAVGITQAIQGIAIGSTLKYTVALGDGQNYYGSGVSGVLDIDTEDLTFSVASNSNSGNCRREMVITGSLFKYRDGN